MLIFHQMYGEGFQDVDQRDKIHILEVEQVSSILQPAQDQEAESNMANLQKEVFYMYNLNLFKSKCCI